MYGFIALYVILYDITTILMLFHCLVRGDILVVFVYITSGSMLTTDVMPNNYHFFIGQLCSKYMYMSTDIN